MRKSVLLISLMMLVGIMAGFVSAYTCADADVNKDNVVNAFDLLAVRQCLNLSASGNCLISDIDKNGMVGEADADIVRQFYLQNCSAQTCTDSDGGINYYVKGITKFSGGSAFNEFCAGSKIIEYSCNGNNNITQTSFDCPNGCSDGVCLCPTTKCSDGTVYGPEKCTVKDNVCICPSCPPKPITCSAMPTCVGAKDTGQKDSDGCASYECPAKPVQTCTDSDGGINYYEKGYIDQTFSPSGRHYDSCVNASVAEEWSCIPDGTFRYDNYACPNGCSDGACIKGEEVKEQVTCVFQNSDVEQKCYTAGENDRAYCSGVGSCVAYIKGYKGEQITWKSSCGQYQYTTMDGNPEKIEFNCGAEETNITQVLNRGFKKVYFQCYDGAESKSIDREACKPAEFWKKFADNFCQSHCDKKSEKCGVNSFSIGEECYLEEENATITLPSEYNCKSDSDCPPINCLVAPCPQYKCVTGVCRVQESEPAIVCKDSCPLDGKCYPFGYRKNSNYCSDDGSFVSQKKNEACDNNFECSSNVCVNGKCVESGFIEKIIAWFKRLFGGG